MRKGSITRLRLIAGGPQFPWETDAWWTFTAPRKTGDVARSASFRCTYAAFKSQLSRLVEAGGRCARRTVFRGDPGLLALDGQFSTIHTSSMESSVSRWAFWLHELIAEAKRRARQRRLLVDVQRLHRMLDAFGDGSQWNAFLSGGGGHTQSPYSRGGQLRRPIGPVFRNDRRAV